MEEIHLMYGLFLILFVMAVIFIIVKNTEEEPEQITYDKRRNKDTYFNEPVRQTCSQCGVKIQSFEYLCMRCYDNDLLN